MDIGQLLELYPVVFHMAEEGSWSSIRERGLLSTTALLDLYGYKGEQRLPIESELRPTRLVISHPDHGDAVIRDQAPMSEKSLAKCLKDMPPGEWYEALNSRCFFWVRGARLLGLLNARLYRNLSHDVLLVDLRDLVDRHLDRIELCAINSGNTKPVARPRGRNTFSSVEDFDYKARKKINPQNPIVELTVKHSVPDISECVIEVRRMTGSVVDHVVYSR